jgi:thymidylate kinase
MLYDVPAKETIDRHKAAGTLIPSLLIYIEVDVDEAYRRILRRGRHTRHYERPADLRKVVSGYQTILEVGTTCADRLIRFDNSSINVEERVKEILLPEVLASLHLQGTVTEML